VLERARAAESALAEHQSTRKALEQSTKKSLQQMTSQLSDAQASQHKAEREANSLRDSVKSLKDVWARELKGVKEDMRNAQEKAKVDLDKAVRTESGPNRVLTILALNTYSIGQAGRSASVSCGRQVKAPAYEQCRADDDPKPR